MLLLLFIYICFVSLIRLFIVFVYFFSSEIVPAKSNGLFKHCLYRTRFEIRMRQYCAIIACRMACFIAYVSAHSRRKGKLDPWGKGGRRLNAHLCVQTPAIVKAAQPSLQIQLKTLLTCITPTHPHGTAVWYGLSLHLDGWQPFIEDFLTVMVSLLQKVREPPSNSVHQVQSCDDASGHWERVISNMRTRSFSSPTVSLHPNGQFFTWRLKSPRASIVRI